MPSRIAVFSDVHANLPALRAVLADLDHRVEQRAVDTTVCLGDLVGYAPWPNEVVEELRRRAISTIAGNYDEGVGLGSDDCGCAYRSDQEKVLGARSIAFTNELVTEENRRYLRSLPRHLRFTFAAARDRRARPLEVLMVHGSPRLINEYLFEDRPDAFLRKLIEGAGADVLLFGHTHKPYHRVLSAGDESGRVLHAINTGSVGKPKDGDPRAGYVILTLDPERTAEEACAVEFVRVPYDVEAAAGAIERSDLPNAFAEMLRLAR